MDPRRRAHAAAAVATLLLLTACANDRDTYPHGEQGASADGSVLRTLAVYVAAPLLIAGVIAALAWLPGMVRGSRYRPQYGWSAAPIWFAGPSDPDDALQRAETGDVVRGGSGGSW